MPKISYENDDFEEKLEIISKPFALDEALLDKVQTILDDVRHKGDDAIIKYTHKWDKCLLEKDSIRVSKDRLIECLEQIPAEIQNIFNKITDNLTSYHKINIPSSWIEKMPNGATLGKLINPINRVGVYVPGGTAPLISTVFMSIIPAKIAGVKEIVVCTPPDVKGKIDPVILAACSYLGINEVYRVGGAQAIGAMAFGTDSIEKVDKVVGPGNAFIAMAKKIVYGVVDIDMIAGPSEILIIADKKANPRWIAADLLSQAEHDVNSRCFVISDSDDILNKVSEEFLLQSKSLDRKDIINKSWQENGWLIKVLNLTMAVDVANNIAPEHLELHLENAEEISKNIISAGAIFVGPYTPEAVGDYIAGPSHVLPTGGTARFYSPLNVQTFLKESSYINYDKKTLALEKDVIEDIAVLESLTAHKNSISIRFE